MKKFILVSSSMFFTIFLNTLAKAGDTGSCGPNCTYNYDPATQTLTFTGTGENGAGVISKSTVYYGLSGAVKNAVIEEGITEVKYNNSDHHVLRDIGTSDGKLIIPSTVTSFSYASAMNLGFGTIEVNSKDITFGSGGSLGLKSSSNAEIVISSDANINIDDTAFYWPWQNSWYYPKTLNISCKGNPDECRSKFGNALDGMNQNKITADYYEERDSQGRLTLKYHDNGYEKYDVNGNVTERWNLDGTEQYDGKGNVIAKYDTNGNLRYAYDVNGSTFHYDTNGNLTGMQKRGPFTIEEADALTKKGNVNKLTITW